MKNSVKITSQKYISDNPIDTILNTVIMHIIPIEFGTPEYDEAVYLRSKVLREPLGLEFSVADLKQEFSEFHFGAYDDNWRLIGCLSVRPLDRATAKVRQVAVLPEYQGRQIGKLMMVFIEDWIFSRGFDKISLAARSVVVDFYIKLGYQVDGDEFTEVGIPHRKMIKVKSI